MGTLMVEYLNVMSNVYGNYVLLRFRDDRAREVRKDPILVQALEDHFGDRFAVVRYPGEDRRDYILSEHIIGIPTPEFDRQVETGEWKVKELTLPAADE
jgi:hypothetical protein